MIHSGTAVTREKRVLRAILFCLAVLAQLMLPAVMMRAEAIAGSLCVTSGGGTDSGPSNFHEHGKQCAHCRLHNCSPLSPPAANAIAVERVHFRSFAVGETAAPRLPAFRAQPPPTGPPAG